jgi:hypothetical protein
VQAATTTVISDNFNRSDGAIGNGWLNTNTTPTASIVNNQLQIKQAAQSGNVTDVAYRPFTETATNQSVSVDVINYRSTINSGVILRLQSSSTIGVRLHSYLITLAGNTDEVYMQERHGTSGTGLIYESPPQSFIDGHDYRFTVTATGSSPTTLTATVYDITSDAQAFTYSTTDSTAALQNPGTVGLYNNNYDVTPTNNPSLWDNFVYTTDDIGTETYTVQASDLWDNGYNNVESPRQSSIARFIFYTNAESVVVNSTTNIVNSPTNYAKLGVRVDDVNQPALSFTTAGTKDFTVSLGAAGTMRKVELISGSLSASSCATICGTYTNSVTYPETADFEVAPPDDAAHKVVIYGDSIAAGGDALPTVYYGFASLLRYDYGYNIQSAAYGSARLATDVGAPLNNAKLDTFVNKLGSYAPETLWLAIGTNDYAHDSMSATDFQVTYAATVDKLIETMPNTHIICQTPVVRKSEVANSFGNTTDDYRAAIVAACTGKDQTYIVDGKAILEVGDISSQAVHPTLEGHAKYAAAVDKVLQTLNPASSFNGLDSHTIGTAEPVTFTVSDDSTNPYKLYDRLASVEVNGSVVSPSDYAVSEGSVVVSLSQDYLDSLAVGTHSLTLAFTGNVHTSSQFTILAEASSANPNTPSGTFSPTVPNTGFNLGKFVGENRGAVLAALAVVIAGLGISVVLVGRKLAKEI